MVEAVAVVVLWYFGVPHFMQQSTKKNLSPRVSPIARMLAVCISAAVCYCANAEPDLVSAPAPDFALRSMSDANIRLSEFFGEVVVINFWATWCGACRQQMPQLEELHDKYRRAGLVVLGVNIDEEREPVVEMVDALKVSYPILFDTRKEVARAYKVGSLPVTVLIDREGTVRYVAEGFKPGYEKRYTEKLRELLGE
ncbi:MAG TPA: TlpA disulfide reductase family protein [Steroidobacteraceae bacterium]